MQGTNIHFLVRPLGTLHSKWPGPALAGMVTVIANTPSAGHCAFDASAING